MAVINLKFGGPKEDRTPINGVTSRYTNHYTMRPYLVETVGLEPTMPGAEDLQSPGVTNFPTSPKLG